MNKALVIVCLFFLGLAQAADFQFYVFASEWRGSVCSYNKCNLNSASSFWNIHGLWPSDGSRGLSFCNDEKFNPNALSNLKSSLSQYWSSLYSDENSFHSHEWQKHGTCSGMSQQDYFGTTLQLALHLDVYGALASAGITPGQKVSCQSVANALTNKYQVNSFTISNQNGYLSQIELCLSKDLRVTECPRRNVCNGSAQYANF